MIEEIVKAARRILLLCPVLLLAAGCILPMPPKVTGPVFSREALAFLDLPDTKRSDVVASLGTPVFEVQNPGVLVYISETTQRSWDVVPIILPDFDDSGQPILDVEDVYHGVDEGPSKERALFVAYDEQGHVFAHKICGVNQATLFSASVQWRRSEGKKHKA